MKTLVNYKVQQIDREGYLLSQGTRLEDRAFGRTILENLKISESRSWVSRYENKEIYIEAFDEPLVVYQIERPRSNAHQSHWKIQGPYDFVTHFDLATLTVDEWDRFHGVSEKGVSFVFSRFAQADFFNLVDELQDDGFRVEEKFFKTSLWLKANEEINDSTFWSPYYKAESLPPWDLDGPHEAVAQLLAQLKIPKSRIAVLGAGRAHDAAYLAEQGHIVTAVDISTDAIAKAKKIYGHLPNLNFHVKNIFELDHSWNDTFDFVFEHTCYCAIPPEKRNDLVKVWRRILTEEGQLFGVFFCFASPTGPPYGGSEWEIQQRLKKQFHFNYWTRWHHSIERRRGIELIVTAQKI